MFFSFCSSILRPRVYEYILYFKQRLSYSKIGLLEEGTRVKPAAPSLPRGGGLFVLVVTPLLFKKTLWLLSSLRKTVGHPTTECFQILQKCLKWFSLCFRSLWLIWSCPKNWLSVRMSLFFNIRCVFSTIRTLTPWPHIISVKKDDVLFFSISVSFCFDILSLFLSFWHWWWEGQIALATYKANISLSNSTAFIKTTANQYLMTMQFSYYFLENLQTPCSHSKFQLAFSVGNPTETALLPLRRTRPGTCYWVAAGLLVAAKIVGATARGQCASGILALERRSSGYERHLEEHNPHLYTSTQNTLFR